MHTLTSQNLAQQERELWEDYLSLEGTSEKSLESFWTNYAQLRQISLVQQKLRPKPVEPVALPNTGIAQELLDLFNGHWNRPSHIIKHTVEKDRGAYLFIVLKTLLFAALGIFTLTMLTDNPLLSLASIGGIILLRYVRKIRSHTFHYTFEFHPTHFICQKHSPQKKHRIVLNIPYETIGKTRTTKAGLELTPNRISQWYDRHRIAYPKVVIPHDVSGKAQITHFFQEVIRHYQPH